MHINNFASIPKSVNELKIITDNFPQILAGSDFKSVISAIVNAYKKNKPVLAMLGGHVIKCGLSLLIIDLMKKNILSAVAMNGSTSIHDFEIGYMGQTSEDVASGLDNGSFGMVRETGELMHSAINEGYKNINNKINNKTYHSRNKLLIQEAGMGELLGRKLNQMKAQYRKYSILSYAESVGIPVTVHTAIGTDTIYQHPLVNGAAMGETSLSDFYKLISIISQLNNGGVVLNIGSAVILPEIFLKALTIARNLNYPVRNFTTVNFDIYQHYRPYENIITRPVRIGGKGYAITGHHEILIPLLYAAVMGEIK